MRTAWPHRWPIALVLALVLEATISWWGPWVKGRHGSFDTAPPRSKVPAVEHVIKSFRSALGPDNLLYSIDSSSGLTLLDSRAGKPLWTRQFRVHGDFAPEIDPDGNVYVLAELADESVSGSERPSPREIRAFSRSGNLLWETTVAPRMESGERFEQLIAGRSGRLLAISRRHAWLFGPGGSVQAVSSADDLRPLGLTDGGGFTLAPIENGEALFDFHNRARWRSSSAQNSVLARDGEGHIYFVYAADDSRLRAMTPSGAKWSRSLEGPIAGVAVAPDGTIIVAAVALYALSPGDGHVLWRFRPHVDFNAGPVLLADGTVVAGRYDRVMGVRAGRLEWDARLPGNYAELRFAQPPVPASDLFVNFGYDLYRVSPR